MTSPRDEFKAILNSELGGLHDIHIDSEGMAADILVAADKYAEERVRETLETLRAEFVVDTPGIIYSSTIKILDDVLNQKETKENE